MKAAVDEKEMVTMKDLEFAKDKILMGEYTQRSDLLCSTHVTSNETDHLATVQLTDRENDNGS